MILIIRKVQGKQLFFFIYIISLIHIHLFLKFLIFLSSKIRSDEVNRKYKNY